MVNIRRKITTERSTQPDVLSIMNLAVDSILKDKIALIELAAKVVTAEQSLFVVMQKAKINEIKRELGSASIVTKRGNNKTEIDVNKYRDKVGEDIFIKSVSVAVGVAKEYLGTKELEEVSNITPGEMKPPVLEVKLYTERKSKK